MMEWNSSNQIIALTNFTSPKKIKSLPNMHELFSFDLIYFVSKFYSIIKKSQVF